MKKKLVIYPFYEELLPILRYKQKLVDFDIVSAIIPKGWDILNGYKEQYEVDIYTEDELDLEDLIHTIDAILLSKPVFHIDITIYKHIITLAEQYDKQIISVPELEPVITKFHGGERIILKPEWLSVSKKFELSSIDVPVIMILGFGDCCEKWDIQLQISDFFRNKGYRASLISSNSLSLLMGDHILPHSVENQNMNFSQQVQQLNAFIKHIELAENPELIVLGVPGGILKFSQNVPNGYGYLPFLISNAVTPDISILSLYCGKYENNHIKELQSTCFYRFGINVNYFHISKKVCNYNPETNNLNYYSVDDAYLDENVLSMLDESPIFNISNTNSREKVFDMIYQELLSNVAVI